MLEAVLSILSAAVTALVMWLRQRDEASKNRAEIDQLKKDKLVIRKLYHSLRDKQIKERQEEIKNVEGASADDVAGLLRTATGAGPASPSSSLPGAKDS